MADPAANNIDWAATNFQVWAEIYLSDIIDAQTADAVVIAAQLEEAGLVVDETNPTESAEAQQVVQLEVATAVFDFGLNEIPQCMLSLNVGREVDTLKPSAAHYLTDILKELIPIRVFIQAGITAGVQYDDFPAGPFTAFDGLVVNSAFRTSDGRAEHTITVVHWLAKLGFSSIVSRLFAPGTPIQSSWDAAMRSLGTTASQAGNVDDIIAGLAFNKLVGAGGDLWGGTNNILSIFTQIANRPMNVVNELKGLKPPAACKLEDGANSSALEALNLIEPAGGVYTFGVPLQLQDAFSATRTKSQFAAHVANSLRDISQTTFWDKIISDYVPSFLLAVVPMVKSALVVPFAPGLQQSETQGDNAKAWKVVYSSEITSGEIVSAITRPIRGVVIMVQRGSAISSVSASDGPGLGDASGGGSFFGAGGIYDTCRDGVFIFRQPPAWLSTIVPPQQYAAQHMNNGGKTVQTNITPNPPGAQAPTVLTPADLALWRAYAQSLYVQEILRFRQARFSGRPRWDIAPGSAIAVELPQDRFVSKVLNPDQTLQCINGVVVRVSTVISSEGIPPSTSFQIAFHRTAAEDVDPVYSYANHPVWAQNWYGAPLVDFTASGI